jgi:hypothetical protein
MCYRRYAFRLWTQYNEPGPPEPAPALKTKLLKEKKRAVFLTRSRNLRAGRLPALIARGGRWAPQRAENREEPESLAFGLTQQHVGCKLFFLALICTRRPAMRLDGKGWNEPEDRLEQYIRVQPLPCAGGCRLRGNRVWNRRDRLGGTSGSDPADHPVQCPGLRHAARIRADGGRF